MAREYAHEELYSADLAVRDAHAMGSLRACPQARKRGWCEKTSAKEETAVDAINGPLS